MHASCSRGSTLRDIDIFAAELARSQHGVFARRQVATGGSEWEIDRRVRVGEWERVHPGVYRLPGVPLTWNSRAMAACLTVDGALTSDLASGHLWGFDSFGPL